MKKINLSDVTEAGDFRKPTAGAYICKITKIENVPLDAATDKGDYLRIWYDIDAGEFKGYYTEMRDNHPEWDWAGRYIRSYKPTALGMFKRFCNAVSRSNNGYVFDAGDINNDEQTLVGKRVGIVFQEEEYESNTGEIKTRLKVNKEFEISKLDEQRVPDPIKLPRKTMADPAANVFVAVGTDDELPFA